MTTNDIREMFPAYRWRWTEDHAKHERFDPYHVELFGLHGRVYLHGERNGVRLQAYTHRPKIRLRLIALPCVVPHQVGDTEATVTFRPEDAPTVFALLRIRRKRRPNPVGEGKPGSKSTIAGEDGAKQGPDDDRPFWAPVASVSSIRPRLRLGLTD